MANQTGQGSDIAKLPGHVAVSADIPQISYGTTAPDPGAYAKSFEALAGSFDKVAEHINDKMDILAQDRGQQAGISAGMKGDVPLRQDGTITGEAYDAAAVRTMIARHDTEARTAAENLFQTNKDNPQGLASGLDSYAEGVASSNLPEEVKANFKLGFARIKSAYMSQAHDRAEAALKDADRASFLGALDERGRTLQRMALRSSSDPAAAATLTSEIKSFQDFALQHGPKGAFTFDGVHYPASNARSGAYSLEDLQKLVIKTTDMTKESAVLGKFLQTSDLQAQRDYLKAFDKTFADGESDFTQEQYEGLASRMRADIDRKESDQRGQLSLVMKGVQQQKDLVEKGYDTGADTINTLVSQAALSGDAPSLAAAQNVKSMIDFQHEARAWRPEQLQSWINTESARVSQPGAVTTAAADRLDLAGKLLNNMTTELKRDPLSWAARVGVINPQPVNLSDPQSMQKRIKDATVVSSHYGTPLQLLTDEEGAEWKSSYDVAPADQRVAMIGMIQTGFGADAVHAFADLSKQSPGLANIGGLIGQSGAHISTARDFTIGDAALAAGTKVLPAGNQLPQAQQAAMGDAYGYAPAAQQAVLDTAERIYAARALRMGKGPDNFDADLYNRALKEASGAWWDRNGVQHGGIIEQKGDHNIVLPPNMTENDFHGLLGSLKDTELTAASVGNGAPLYQNGKTMTPEDLRHFWLISTGPGRYAVSTTNPILGNPVYLMGTNPDGIYEMDVQQLQARRAKAR